MTLRRDSRRSYIHYLVLVRVNDARWSWRPTVFVAGVELLLLLLLAIFQQDILFPLASAFVALVLLVSNIVVLIYAAIRKRLRQLAPTLVTLAILWVIPMALLFYGRAYPFRLRETAQWMAFSRAYKAEVFAQRNSDSGDLKHVEWDGAGFAGVANHTVMLAFDPANTLSAVAKSLEVNVPAIPNCFFANLEWNIPNTEDKISAGHLRNSSRQLRSSYCSSEQSASVKLNHSVGVQRNSGPVTPFLGF